VTDDRDRDLDAQLREEETTRLFVTARLFLKQNRLGDTQEVIDQLKAREPESSEVWELQGDLHRRKGERKAAQEAFKQAFALDGTNADAERKFAEMALFLGEEERSRRSQRELLEDPTRKRAQPRNPVTAALYSCLFPGFGQLHNREHEKGLLLFGIAVIILMLLVNGVVIVPLQTLGRDVRERGALSFGEQFDMWREHLALIATWQWLLVILGILAFVGLQVFSIIDAYRTAHREVQEAEKLGV
jgi:tetratricopeptide (TPR) repeat protein